MSISLETLEQIAAASATKPKQIILGITGSIAAYKSISLAQTLLKDGHEVYIVLSKSAPEFISILTLKTLFPGKVYLHDDHLDCDDNILHTKLAYQADIVLIAPASAQIIAALAGGFADCLLTSICLAMQHSATLLQRDQPKILLAPAMNVNMWQNTITQSNIAKLYQYGYGIIPPSIEKQACGDYGDGRMAEPKTIANHMKYSHLPKLLRGKKIVITAASTIEELDAVRFLSCYGSGRMGYYLAEIACRMGADVVLISRHTHAGPLFVS